MKKLSVILCSLLMGLCLSFSANAEDKVIKSAWLNEIETLPVWYAIEKGMDKQKGYRFELVSYPTGTNMVGSMGKDWIFGVAGIVPVLQAVDSNKAEIFAMASEENMVNKIFTRKDNESHTVQGLNKEFPLVFGSADLVRGTTVLCPLNTNAHQLLLAWLNILGLQDKDVSIVDTKPEDALRAFEEGYGDYVVLWAPDSLKAEEMGLPVMASAVDCDVYFQTVFFGNQKVLEENKAELIDFMEIYYQALDELEAMDLEQRTLLYQELYQKNVNKELDAQVAENTLLLQRIKKKSVMSYKAIEDSVEFYAKINAIPRREHDRLKSMDYVKTLF